MKFLSVCSGIEAASVAWEPLGFRPVAFSEIEPFPCSVLAHRFPETPNLGDMTKFEEWNLGDQFQVLVGGTPCQSFSIAGLRAGLDDQRGNLALTYCRILQRFKPRWFVWENVPGVLSSNGGRDFGSILGAMVELGYGIAYRILDAQFFGVPQRRRRVFVVGHLGDWRRAAAVLFEPGCVSGDSKAGRKKRKDVAGSLASRTSAGGGLGTDFDLDGGLQVSPITSRPYGDRGAGESRLVVGTLGSHHGNVRADHAWTGQLIPFDTTQITSSLNRSNPKPGDPCHPIPACGHPPAIASTGNIAHCLNAGGMGRQDYETETMVVAFSGRNRGDDGRGYDRPPNVTGDIAGTVDTVKPGNIAGPTIGVRRLTPRECERLQGFPDDWTLVPHRGKPAADGPRYKAIGNSMAVPVMRWIGKRIMEVSQ